MGHNQVEKPLLYDSVRAHRLEVLNDWSILLIIYFVIQFTDLNSADSRNMCGWFLLGVLSTAICLQLMFVIGDIIKAFYKSLKNCVKKCKEKRALKKKNLEPIPEKDNGLALA
jgi:hypothetical protein